MTPLQMFTSGSLVHNIQLDNFHGDVDSALQLDASGVTVPRTASRLTSAQEDELKALVDPLQDSSNYAIEVYDQVRQFVLDNSQ